MRDGVTLAYEERGAGGVPMVFVHGWTCNRTHWEPQLAHFAARGRVIGVDLRGHGKSDAPRQAYSPVVFADDIAWMCGQLGVAEAVFVGHSMGGAVVLELAAAHPELVAGAVMVDAAPIGDPAVLASLAADMHDQMVNAGGNAARLAMVGHAAGGFEADPVLGERIRAEMMATAEHVAVACILSLGEWDGQAAARRCAVPVLHIAADDPINDAAALRALNPLIRTGQTVGGAHFNHLQVPEQVNAMIERFMARLGS